MVCCSGAALFISYAIMIDDTKQGDAGRDGGQDDDNGSDKGGSDTKTDSDDEHTP